MGRLSSGNAPGYLSVIALLTWSAQQAAALNAFPGAEGWGAETTGARGSTWVYHVTSLSDANTTGTFRNAVTKPLQPGETGRTVVFDVGGLITMNSKIVMNVPNLTIAGQTAPGEGITLTGWDTYISASNISLRYMHFRPGNAHSPFNGGTYEGDSLSVFGSSSNIVNNVIIDHVSTSWSIDENLSATWANKVTVQNSIIAEALNNAGHSSDTPGVTETHAYGSLIGSGNGLISYTRNFYSSNRSRNPRVGSDITLDFVNNVTYNWNGMNGYSGPASEGITKVNYIGNYGIAGPGTASHKNDVFTGGSTNTRIFQSGNFIDGDQDALLDGANTNWAMFTGTYTQMPSAFPSGPYAPTVDTALGAYNGILQNVGASLQRDANDTRMLNNLINHTGAIIDSQTQVGFTAPATLARAAGYDTDLDGIPNAWETSHGLNASLASDNNKPNPLGYTVLEQFLNESALASTPVRTSTSSGGEWNSPAKWSAVAPTMYDVASIQGNGAGTNGTVTLSTTAAASQLFMGGNGGAAGEKLLINGGTLTLVDTAYIGNAGPATLQLDAGMLKADNVQLGTTLAGVSNAGTLTLNGGTLKFRQIVLGAGTPGNWNAGGMVAWSAATLSPLGTYFVNAPITLNGPGTLSDNGHNGTFGNTLNGPGGLAKNGTGTLTLSANVSLDAVTAVNAGRLVLFGATNSFAAITGAGDVALAPSKSLTADGITINSLTLGANATAAIRPSGNSTSKLYALTLAGSANAWSARLDLANNTLLLQTTTASKPTVLSTLANQLLSGRAANWAGRGITSSTTAADVTGNSTLALIDNADLGASTFGGQASDADTLIITRALLGDADLSGTVDLADFDRWLANVSAPTYSFSRGDFDTSGVVDLADFDTWLGHVGVAGLSVAPFVPASSVPEPASLLILALGVPVLVRRR